MLPDLGLETFSFKNLKFITFLVPALGYLVHFFFSNKVLFPLLTQDKSYFLGCHEATGMIKAHSYLPGGHQSHAVIAQVVSTYLNYRLESNSY